MKEREGRISVYVCVNIIKRISKRERECYISDAYVREGERRKENRV